MRNRQRGTSLEVSRRELIAYGSAALTAAAGLGLALPAQAAASGFVFANESDYDMLDPHQVFDIGRIAIRLNMYDALMRWRQSAEARAGWSRGTRSRRTARNTRSRCASVKFHDGSPMTSEDVVYSMERILALASAASLFKDVVVPGATKAHRPQTVEFNLKEPFAVFLAVLSELWVVNSELVKRNEKDGDWGRPGCRATRPAAAATRCAVRSRDRLPGRARFEGHFTLSAEPDRRRGFPRLMETATRVLGVMKGEFNTTDGYLPREQMARMKADPNIKTWEAESIRTFYFIQPGRRRSTT